MSVIMTLIAQGDAAKLEQLVAQDPTAIRSITDSAEQNGLIAHRFYGSDDGRIMAVDEWPDAESFKRFFESEQARIGPIMQQAGVTSEPEITFWRKLETHDEVGWEN